MGTDPWQQWRAFTALFGGAGSVDPTGYASSPDIMTRFKNAAQNFLGSAAAAAPTAESARAFGDALRDLFTQLQPPWSFGGPASAPAGASGHSPSEFALGATREHQLRWLRLSHAWAELDATQRRLQRLWMDALREAANAFASRLGQPASVAVGPEVLHRLYDTWIDCAEEAYSEVAHSAPFCDAFADSVNAGSRWRRELQSIVEQSAKLLDLPTRSELNTMHQRLRAVEALLREATRPPEPGSMANAGSRGNGGSRGSAGSPGSVGSQGRAGSQGRVGSQGNAAAQDGVDPKGRASAKGKVRSKVAVGSKAEKTRRRRKPAS